MSQDSLLDPMTTIRPTRGIGIADELRGFNSPKEDSTGAPYDIVLVSPRASHAEIQIGIP